jgi:hypothetical protein
MRKFIQLSFLTVLSLSLCRASGFNVTLQIDVESAEKTIELYEGLSGRPDLIAALRGSQIALATSSLLLQRQLTTHDLERALEDAKFNQISQADPFRMREPKERVEELKELLHAVQNRNFSQKVVSTVEQLFPDRTEVNAWIPVFFVAFGHQNVDAFVRRVKWKNETPAFVGEGHGELTIVINLSKAVGYGRTTDERFIVLLSVVAHEVFHAAFGAYKDRSPTWRAYYALSRDYLDQLLDLTQNEGIAHYLSMIQRTGGRLRPGDLERVYAAFAEFNRTAAELLSRGVAPYRASELIRNSNTSGYWESYGAITGMIVARQIDQSMGRQALMETIALGPDDFFRKYVRLARRDGNLPLLGDEVVGRVGGE